MAGERTEARDQPAGGRWRRGTLPLGLMMMVLAPGADAATLTVGKGKQYRTVAGAVAAARDGDAIQVQAGTYTNDFAIVGKKISIVGVGGMARLVATTAIGNGKAILVTTTDVTLDHVELAGARVADRNGAGIRYEGGKLTVRKCYFHDNENGILANASATGTISIAGSEFARNGYGDGCTHGVYVNRIASLTITNSYFHDTRVGHHIKSRASKTTVSGSPSSTARTAPPATTSTCRTAGRHWSAATSSSRVPRARTRRCSTPAARALLAQAQA